MMLINIISIRARRISGVRITTSRKFFCEEYVIRGLIFVFMALSQDEHRKSLFSKIAVIYKRNFINMIG